MSTLSTALDRPYAFIEKNGVTTLYQGEFLELDTLDELERLQHRSDDSVIFLLPFNIAKEKEFDVLGNEKILALRVTDSKIIDSTEYFQENDQLDIIFEKNIEPNVSDEDFENMVKAIQKDEIEGGNACQVVFSRKFIGKIKDRSPKIPLTLFARLLKQKGQYFTFLFADGRGNFFVGATPERQLEMYDGKAIKNPIAGTMKKGNAEDFEERIFEFLRDNKEINELAQVLDEELKMMSQISPKGGKIVGPLLREVGAVVHTEYDLFGHDSIEPPKALKESFHAPTLVGSPLESAFRIIAKREPESRRYYGGEFGILKSDHELDSAILIRSAEIDQDGKVVIQAGAGIVRDSTPAKEAMETRIKAEGMIRALKGEQTRSEAFVDKLDPAKLKSALSERNRFLSRFHFEDQFDCDVELKLQGVKVTVINNEDNFAHMVAHMVIHMGCDTIVVDTFDYSLKNDDSDIVIIGPGPGDINDSSERMRLVRELTEELIKSNKKVLGLCLGHQSIAKALGMNVIKQTVSTQGLQRAIDLFGKKEKVGFYNSFSPTPEGAPDDLELSLDENNRVMALRKIGLISYQFHPESIMSQNGYDILRNTLTALK